MGRYYQGDIEGKFWFALQSSNAASRFGGEQFEPQFIEYYFNEEHLATVNEEIKNIQESLGDNIKVIEDFFKTNQAYNDKDLEAICITQDILRDYADLLLGSGQCSFQAEL